jgi:hypothetical protein
VCVYACLCIEACCHSTEGGNVGEFGRDRPLTHARGARVLRGEERDGPSDSILGAVGRQEGGLTSGSRPGRRRRFHSIRLACGEVRKGVLCVMAWGAGEKREIVRPSAGGRRRISQSTKRTAQEGNVCKVWEIIFFVFLVSTRPYVIPAQATRKNGTHAQPLFSPWGKKDEGNGKQRFPVPFSANAPDMGGARLAHQERRSKAKASKKSETRTRTETFLFFSFFFFSTVSCFSGALSCEVLFAPPLFVARPKDRMDFDAGHHLWGLLCVVIIPPVPTPNLSYNNCMLFDSFTLYTSQCEYLPHPSHHTSSYSHGHFPSDLLRSTSTHTCFRFSDTD